MPMLEARLLHLKGNNGEALARIDSVLEFKPQDIDALLLRGRIELASGKFTEAISTLEQLTQTDPSQL